MKVTELAVVLEKLNHASTAPICAADLSDDGENVYRYGERAPDGRAVTSVAKWTACGQSGMSSARARLTEGTERGLSGSGRTWIGEVGQGDVGRLVGRRPDELNGVAAVHWTEGGRGAGVSR